MQLFGCRAPPEPAEELIQRSHYDTSTHIARFKRWPAREGGEWEGRKGSKIKRGGGRGKKGTRGVGEEKRREGEQGK